MADTRKSQASHPMRQAARPVPPASRRVPRGSRRTHLLRTATLGGVLLVSTALTGCASLLYPSLPLSPPAPPVTAPELPAVPESGWSTPAGSDSSLPGLLEQSGRARSAPSQAAASTPAGPPIIMIIRHGEKPDEDVSPLPGINEAGRPDESSMTKVGWDRAYKLVDLFAPAKGEVKPGLARPAVLYAARPTEEGKGQRTRETVVPLSKRLGTQINTSFGKGEERQLAADVLKQTGPVLISWQHGEIPAMAEAFGSTTPAAPAEWPDERFDMVWTLTKGATGWNFNQVPEMVLPGDQVVPFPSGQDGDGD